jgi:hypothetical protein
MLGGFCGGAGHAAGYGYLYFDSCCRAMQHSDTAWYRWRMVACAYLAPKAHVNHPRCLGHSFI